MDIQYIPKTFWHALSIAVLIVTIGLTYIAYRSSSVSIELADAKINLTKEVTTSTIALSEALEEAKRAKADAEKKYDEVVNINENLRTTIAELREQPITDAQVRERLDTIKVPEIEQKLSFETFDSRVDTVQQSLKNIDEINKQYQMLK